MPESAANISKRLAGLQHTDGVRKHYIAGDADPDRGPARLRPAPMPTRSRDTPQGSTTPARFRATVHGSVFEHRAQQLDRIEAGDALLLLADPPEQDPPAVWVHRTTGDPVGHLPPEIAAWLAPWMLKGGQATARALRVRGPDSPSWRRLLIEVECGPSAA